MNRQGFTVTVAPTGEPITLDQAKAQTRIDIADDDTLVTRLITAARVFVETNCRRGLMTQTVVFQIENFPDRDRLDLHVIAPLASITSVEYYDSDGDNQTFDSASYVVDSVTEPGAIQLLDGYEWPSTARRPDAVRVTAVIGFGDADDVPEDLVHAIHMLVAHLYEHRETVSEVSMTEVPLAVQSLMGPYLRPEFF